MAIEIIMILILFVTFFVYGIVIWSSDIDRARAKNLELDNENLNKGIVIGFSVAIFLSFITMAIWFRVFKICQLLSHVRCYSLLSCTIIAGECLSFMV